MYGGVIPEEDMALPQMEVVEGPQLDRLERSPKCFLHVHGGLYLFPDLKI